MPIPDQCPPQSSIFNTSPLLSSFACDILKALGLPNVNPVLQEPKLFDYSKYTTVLEQLSGTGDPRWTMGAMFTDLLDNVIPHIVAQTEILQAGGCQIIDQFICDSNGKPIKSTSSSCSGVPVAITNEYIQTYINEQLLAAKTNAANDFFTYIQNNFVNQQWTLAAYLLTIPGLVGNIFYIAATKNTQVQYLKYYPDQAEYITRQLDIPLTTIDTTSITDTKVFSVLSKPISSYQF